MAGNTHRRGQDQLAPAAIILATLAAYGPAVRAGFIWDDDGHVTRPELQSWAGLARIWGQPGATQQYYPVLHTAFWLEHRLWGDAPSGYHLCNLILHATAACLFALVLCRLWGEGGRKAAWFGGMIFALHPVCVESVAWISEQKNTLSAVFYLWAALAYLRWQDGATAGFLRRRGYWLATVLFLLALLSKTVAATLPAAILVVLWWKKGRLEWRRDWAPLTPWLAAGAAAGLFTSWVERNYIGADASGFGLGPVERVLLAGRVIWFYLGKLLWPKGLIFIYPHWTINAGEAWKYGFPAGVLIVTGWLWARRGQQRGPAAGWLLFVGTLFPALGFFNVYPFMFSYVADHFQYLASLGIIGLGAAAWDRLRIRRARPAAALAAVLAGALALLTWRQCSLYASAEKLYRHTLAHNPGCWLMAYNLGVILDHDGRTREAMEQYGNTLKTRPDMPDARVNLGIDLARAGRVEQAVAQFRQAVAWDEKAAGPDASPAQAGASPARAGWYRSNEAEAAYNLGRAYSALAKESDAALSYELALRLEPRFALARDALAEIDNRLALALIRTGRLDEAAARLESALRAKPDFAGAEFNLANIRLEQHRVAGAIAGYERTVLLQRDFTQAYLYLGRALAADGQDEPALESYRKGLQYGRPDPRLDRLLGTGFRDLRRYAEAIACYQKALRLRPDYAEAENDWGIAEAQSGHPEKSVPHFEAALRLRPEFPEARANLDVVERALGKRTRNSAIASRPVTSAENPTKDKP